MTHPSRRDELLDLALGLLEPDQARALEAHADGCAACREELAALRRTRRLLAELPPVEAPAHGTAALLAAARQAAEQARPRRAAPGWWWGGSLGLAGAAALALLVIRLTGPAPSPPGSDDHEALLGRAAPAGTSATPPTGDALAAPAPAPAEAAATVASTEAPRPRRVRSPRPAKGAEPGAGGAERRVADTFEEAKAEGVSGMAKAVPAVASASAAPAPAGPAGPAEEAEAMAGAGPATGTGLAEASGALRAKAAAAPRAAPLAADAAREGAAPIPCWRETRRRFTLDAAGKVDGRVRQGRYPAAAGEVALLVEERFGSDGRLLSATVRAGEEQFTVSGAEVAAGRLEPLPGVRLARSVGEASTPPPRCPP